MYEIDWKLWMKDNELLILSQLLELSCSVPHHNNLNQIIADHQSPCFLINTTETPQLIQNKRARKFWQWTQKGRQIKVKETLQQFLQGLKKSTKIKNPRSWVSWAKIQTWDLQNLKQSTEQCSMNIGGKRAAHTDRCTTWILMFRMQNKSTDFQNTHNAIHLTTYTTVN